MQYTCNNKANEYKYLGEYINQNGTETMTVEKRQYFMVWLDMDIGTELLFIISCFVTLFSCIDVIEK